MNRKVLGLIFLESPSLLNSNTQTRQPDIHTGISYIFLLCLLPTLPLLFPSFYASFPSFLQPPNFSFLLFLSSSSDFSPHDQNSLWFYYVFLLFIVRVSSNSSPFPFYSYSGVLSSACILHIWWLPLFHTFRALTTSLECW